MRLKQDIVLDLIYSILFCIVILVNSQNLTLFDSPIVFVWKNFILIGILALWVKSLSRKNKPMLLIKDYPASKGTPFKSSYLLLNDFIQGKLACFALMFSVYSFFNHAMEKKFFFAMLYFEITRIILVGFYTLFILLITVSYVKKSPGSWVFTALLLGPYLVFVTLISLLGPGSEIYFALLPSNFEVVFLSSLMMPQTIIVVGISLIAFFTMVLFFIKAIKRLLTGTKYMQLDPTRVN